MGGPTVRAALPGGRASTGSRRLRIYKESGGPKGMSGSNRLKGRPNQETGEEPEQDEAAALARLKTQLGATEPESAS
jgi:hypothetical protein